MRTPRPATHEPTREPGCRPDPVPITRTRQSLLNALETIDSEGWDGPTGTTLLQSLRTEMVRPLAIDSGLRGAAASQAEATAWEAVWLAMTKPSLRTTGSPWGVLWQVARRAVLGEIVAAQFSTADRRAWELAMAARHGKVVVPISLDALAAASWEPSSAEPDPALAVVWHDVLADARDALIAVGWQPATARRIVTAVVDLQPPPDPRSTIVGWRLLATELDLPAWQARRLALALRGTATSPGLLPRLISSGRDALDDTDARLALAATRHRPGRRSSTSQARDSVTASTRYPQAAAS